MSVYGGTFSRKCSKTFANSSSGFSNYTFSFTSCHCVSDSRKCIHSWSTNSNIERHDPFFVCITLCGLSAIFKPYPSIADTNLYLTLLTVYPHLFQHTKYLFLVACALLYCCIFGPAFYYLWIYAGSGNANFFYAITLVWNLAQGILLSDTIFATLKEEWEQEEPEKRLGKNLEVSQIAD